MATVLIVDDERSIRSTLAEFLRGAGYTVETAEDATQAERWLQRQRFDVVVTDIVLPRVSGVELLKRIRVQAPDSLVLMMTGEPTTESAVAAVRAGAYDYLVKPVSKEVILRVVGRAVEIRTLQEEQRRLEAANREYQIGLERMVEERTRSLRESQANLARAEAFSHGHADRFGWPLAQGAASARPVAGVHSRGIARLPNPGCHPAGGRPGPLATVSGAPGESSEGFQRGEALLPPGR